MTSGILSQLSPVGETAEICYEYGSGDSGYS